MSERHVPVKQKSNYYGWLPINPEVHRAFIDLKMGKARNRRDRKTVLVPEVVAFAKAIDDDSFMRECMLQVFRQVNKDPQVWPNWRHCDDDVN